MGNFAAGRIINIYGAKATLTPWIIFGIASGVVAITVLFIRNLPINQLK